MTSDFQPPRELPLNPASLALNEPLELIHYEETLRRMDEEPADYVAHNIDAQELPSGLNLFDSAQSTTDEFVGDFISPQCGGGNVSHPNSINIDQYTHFSDLSLVSQCETPSAADLERNVSPFADVMSPKTYQKMVESVKKDTYLSFQGCNQQYFPIDGGLTFAECFSHKSVDVTGLNSSSYTSSESQCEELQPTTTNSTFNLAPSPMIAQSLVAPCTSGIQPNTPGIQFSEVEQGLSMDRSKVNVIFNSNKSASNCCHWYGMLCQIVPEVVKPQQSMKKEQFQIKLPEEGIVVNEKKELLKEMHSCDHKDKKKSAEVSNFTEQEVLRNGNDDNKDEEILQLPTPINTPSPSSSSSSCEGARNHQSGHQLTHHNPPIASHYGHWQYELEIQKEQVKLLLKEQDKKYSELFKEQDMKYSELFKEKDKELQLLKEQVNNLQGRLAGAEGDVNANNELSREQNTKVSMILTNQSISWRVALRRILEIVFEKELLAQSCCVGRKHATYKGLDARKLDVVRALIFNTYGPNQEITNEAINVIVNSCCTTARRSLKQAS